ncbi:hypothetical protein B9Z55_016445 [Caenorhabditis nigoni]|uniref:7TM GPCR serpentine receptor class x (Srx) domain-containing protein n=1 Tax=Caenorhabditis nigoni TaxID=1611254 RepID=A0A2G5T518_9PELO|nr:hypothetical protein B9Z55_016445 [Caenorhabditis nigoni]
MKSLLSFHLIRFKFVLFFASFSKKFRKISGYANWGLPPIGAVLNSWFPMKNVTVTTKHIIRSGLPIHRSPSPRRSGQHRLPNRTHCRCSQHVHRRIL